MNKNSYAHLPMTGLGLVTALALAGCGGGGGGGGGVSSSSGSLTVAVTDAPVDNAQNVWIEFTEVEVQGEDGTRHLFTLSPPKRIDLLSLTGGATVKLLDDQELPAGDYSWIRLYVDEANSSLVDAEGAEQCLDIPRNEDILQLNWPSDPLVAGGVANFVIDFDLRKSVKLPANNGACYKLRPTARIVDASISGGIEGTVDPALYTSSPCAENAALLEYGAVYVYSGSGVTPDDVGGAGVQPLASAQVIYENSVYRYEVPYLDAGTYTVAFACDAVNDLPDTDEAISFYGPADVSVSNDTTITHDFVATPP